MRKLLKKHNHAIESYLTRALGVCFYSNRGPCRSIPPPLSGIPFTSAALAKEKDEDDSESELTIEKTVLAREVEDRFEPVKSFKSDDTFAVLVFLSEPKIGTHVKAIWTIVDAGGTESKKILEKEVEITAKAIEGVEEPNRINFSLTHDDPFPAGDYKTDIYLNGELVKTVEFKVK